MDSSWTSKLGPEQFKPAVLRAWDALSTTGLWMDEISAFLEQSTLCQEKLLARALAQMQINISDAVESEPLTPPTKDMGVDPISLDTTTKWIALCIAETLAEYHADDNGLRERNLHSSDTKNERISISPSTSLSQDSASNSLFPGDTVIRNVRTRSKCRPVVWILIGCYCSVAGYTLDRVTNFEPDTTFPALVQAIWVFFEKKLKNPKIVEKGSSLKLEAIISYGRLLFWLVWLTNCAVSFCTQYDWSN